MNQKILYEHIHEKIQPEKMLKINSISTIVLSSYFQMLSLDIKNKTFFYNFTK